MEGYVPGAGDGTAGRPLGVGGGVSSCSLSGRAATIRPLTAAYQASSGLNQVLTCLSSDLIKILSVRVLCEGNGVCVFHFWRPCAVRVTILCL